MGRIHKRASMGRGCQCSCAPIWGVPPPRLASHEPLLSALGANIQAARKEKGLTQEQLAELIEVHPRIMQKMEAGDLNPKTTTIIRIQAYLDCPWDQIMPKIRPTKRAVKKPRG
jgi:DNA-binding XRE family transcriptional regulator